ncbi:MAG TPA: 5-(carboxyamino)imidazole ribonucleotide synthase [Polyangiaceae bacterium]|nr:5-(carboxyamino)imidazole ribonucleotide synthase [Polyangiaceae bacterium]
MAILPNSTVGILGGGQLGRMTAMAAREMGYRVKILDPDPSAAARFLADDQIVAQFDDVDAAVALARQCDVVTLEIEKVGHAALVAAAEHAPVRPGAAVLAVIRERVTQKTWLESNGFPVGPFRVARSFAELEHAHGELAGPCFIKASSGGYDGRGQFEASGPEQAADAWAALFPGAPRDDARAVVERALDIDLEISVMVARNARGDVAVYPPAENHHEHRILAWSVLPASIAPELASRATDVARRLATTIGLEGLLCVELFVVGGKLLVNELAPRPHNSYHTTFVGSATSQFEQHVRAICDLPLGSTEIVRPAAIANLLGDLWVGDRPPAFERALELPCVRLHLYGKAVARPGRKMGHLSATAPSGAAALALVKRARAALERADGID